MRSLSRYATKNLAHLSVIFWENYLGLAITDTCKIFKDIKLRFRLLAQQSSTLYILVFAEKYLNEKHDIGQCTRQAQECTEVEIILLHAHVLPESEWVAFLFESEIVKTDSEDEADIVEEIEYCHEQLEGSTLFSS